MLLIYKSDFHELKIVCMHDAFLWQLAVVGQFLFSNRVTTYIFEMSKQIKFLVRYLAIYQIRDSPPNLFGDLFSFFINLQIANNWNYRIFLLNWENGEISSKGKLLEVTQMKINKVPCLFLTTNRDNEYSGLFAI